MGRKRFFRLIYLLAKFIFLNIIYNSKFYNEQWNNSNRLIPNWRDELSNSGIRQLAFNGLVILMPFILLSCHSNYHVWRMLQRWSWKHEISFRFLQRKQGSGLLRHQDLELSTFIGHLLLCLLYTLYIEKKFTWMYKCV